MKVQNDGKAFVLSGLEMRQNRCEKINSMKIALKSLKNHPEMLRITKYLLPLPRNMKK